MLKYDVDRFSSVNSGILGNKKICTWAYKRRTKNKATETSIKCPVRAFSLISISKLII